MKIKFLKDFMATQSDDFRDLHPILIKRGDIVDVDGCEYNDSYFDMPKEQAQWLIENGFVEKVKESDWEPKSGEKYYFVDGYGKVGVDSWCNDELDECRYSVGNVFKVRELAQTYIEYLKAVATVSQDKGFMLQTTRGNGVVDSDVVAIVEKNGRLQGWKLDYSYRRAGDFYFDTFEHAYSSIAKHHSAWQTIYDYKWRKG